MRFFSGKAVLECETLFPIIHRKTIRNAPDRMDQGRQSAGKDAALQDFRQNRLYGRVAERVGGQHAAGLLIAGLFMPQ